MAIVYIIMAIIWGVVWGIVTNKVIANKGYYENWVWWGFFFGWIALIVALTKPDNNNSQQHMNNQQYVNNNSALSMMAEQKKREEQIRSGYWQCSCGEFNPPYMASCSCGRKPRDVIAEKAKEAAVEEDEKELNNLKKLKEYKELLDAGVITQEEFEAKKAKLL